MEKTAIRQSGNIPWYERVRRWGQTNLTEDDPIKCDLDFWRGQWKRTGVQGIIINCGGIVAYYPSRYALQYRAKFLAGGDYFKEWSDAAREAGLAVIARMDINRATQAFYEAHPDWFCVDSRGEPYRSADDRYYSCVNSGYYGEYIPTVLEEIIEAYAPEGFTDNSWKGMGRDSVCYCANCRARFKADCGLDLPEKVSWDDPVYRSWIRWSYRRRTDNWDMFNKVTTAKGGKDCLWLGMLGGSPINKGGAFVDLKTLCERSKLIFSDHQMRDIPNGFEMNAQSGTLLRLASLNEDTPAPESMATYTRGARAFRLSAAPAAEVRTWMLSGIAGGISPWYHHIGGSRNDRRMFETPLPIFEWHRDNEQYLYHREDMANIGLVWSGENADFYGRDEVVERCAYPWRGFGLAMSKYRMPYLPIHADHIARYASRIKTLILPDVAILSPSQLDALLTFARSGGSLIVSGVTGTLDADGLPSDDGRLWELLGLRLTGEIHGISKTLGAGWDSIPAHSYLRLPEKRHALFNGLEETDIIGFGGALRAAVSNGPLAPLGTFVPAFPPYPPELSWIREERPRTNPVYAGELPGGGRAVYFAADIDRCCGRHQLPDHALVLANAVKWCLRDDLPLRVEGPGFLECKAYRQGERRIVHIVNLSNANICPGYLEEILPVGPIEVSVRVGNREPGRAALRVANCDAAFSVNGGYAKVTLKSIKDHEFIVLE